MSYIERKAEEILERLTEAGAKISDQIKDCEDKIQKATKEKMVAQDQGDLRENSEYQTAIEKLGRLNVLLAELHNKQRAWQRFNDTQKTSDFVGIGSTVELLAIDTNKTYFGMLVPAELGDSSISTIAEDAPVGKAISGKVVGEEVTAKTPVDTSVYKILSIY